MTVPITKSSAVSRLLVFWWALFVIIQQAERVFLLPETAAREVPTAAVLMNTLATGLVADVICATGALAIAAMIGVVLTMLTSRLSAVPLRHGLYGAWLNRTFMGVGCLLLVLLIVDMGYYGFSQQRVNFVFFEYLDDLIHTPGNETGASQAVEQTAAELGEAGKWGTRIAIFLVFEALSIAGWCFVFLHTIVPMLRRWNNQRPVAAAVMAATILIGGVAGLGPLDFPSHTMGRASDAYFNLAQNPVLVMGEPLRDAFVSRWSWAPRHTPEPMTLEEAVRLSQDALAPHARFPFEHYPFVRVGGESGDRLFDQPVNVILLFVEGLDRRFLDRTIEIPARGIGSTAAVSDRPEPNRLHATSTPSFRSIRVTPFLDRLKEDSLYFEHFFSNGVATTRGLFSTFCSYYPRQGTSVIKTRYGQDYLCVPSILKHAGFKTEMVIGLDSDIPGIRPFMQRNGLDRLYGEADFPSTAERLGVGLTDGALFEFLRSRIEALQTGGQAFFLAALTASTHHPFVIPVRDSEVNALQQLDDQYVAALHYFDLEFGRLFTGLQQDGLLRNSMVIVLGDHGRHEPVGTTDAERQAGRFMSPLFIWLDHSVRVPNRYRPRHIESVASQVDLGPTILAVQGLLPRVSPFVGRNLGCLFASDCLFDHATYLSNVYDDSIGLADRDGLWFYSFHREALWHVDLKLRGPAHPVSIKSPDGESRSRRMIAMYLASNTLLEQNRVWSPGLVPGAP